MHHDEDFSQRPAIHRKRLSALLNSLFMRFVIGLRRGKKFLIFRFTRDQSGLQTSREHFLLMPIAFHFCFNGQKSALRRLETCPKFRLRRCRLFRISRTIFKSSGKLCVCLSAFSLNLPLRDRLIQRTKLFTPAHFPIELLCNLPILFRSGLLFRKTHFTSKAQIKLKQIFLLLILNRNRIFCGFARNLNVLILKRNVRQTLLSGKVLLDS